MQIISSFLLTRLFFQLKKFTLILCLSFVRLFILTIKCWYLSSAFSSIEHMTKYKILLGSFKNLNVFTIKYCYDVLEKILFLSVIQAYAEKEIRVLNS